MTKYAMIFDKEACIGCNACVVSCQQNYQVPPENKLNWVKVNEKGDFPDIELEFEPYLCGHCDDPICIDVCPVKDATYKTEEGYVLMNHDNCIGCMRCVEACPFGARSMSAETNTCVKCTFCADIVENGGTPICVNTCPTGARIFGDLDDPNSQVSQILSSDQAERYDLIVRPDGGMLGPNFYYLKEETNDQR